MTTETETSRDIHTWFSLSYSNYLVLPRTLLQSMPEGWQHRFVAALEELDDAFAHIEHADCYIVEAAVECTYSDLSRFDMENLGVTSSDGDPDRGRPRPPGTVYWDRRGDEHQPGDQVLVPRLGGDPVPHYQRGRTYIEPRLRSEG